MAIERYMERVMEVSDVKVGDWLFFYKNEMEHRHYHGSVTFYLGRYGKKRLHCEAHHNLSFAFQDSDTVFKAHPFHIVLKSMETYISEGDALFMLPEIEDVPTPTNSDETLLMIFNRVRICNQLIDTIGDGSCVLDFHKWFRQIDVIDEPGYDSIIYSLLRDAPLFWYVMAQQYPEFNE